MAIKMLNELLSDPAWLANYYTQRSQELAKRTTNERRLTAYEKIEALAKEKVSKGEAKDLPESIEQVAAENTSLYATYKAELRAGIRQLPPVAVPKVMLSKSAPLQKIEAQAAALRKVFIDNGCPMTASAAICEVVQQNPGLYAEYRAERRQRLRGGR